MPKTKVTAYFPHTSLPYEYLTNDMPGDGITAVGIIFTTIEGDKVMLSNGLPWKMETLKQEN